MEKKKDKIILRYLIFVIGLFTASLGVAFSAQAGLGTSPVSSVPYSVSLLSSVFTFGGWLNVFSMIQIAVQVLILRKKCNPVEIIIQVILAFVYGYLTNFSCYLVKDIPVDTYPKQLLCMAAGCFILAFGIFIQFRAGVAMLPGEAMNRAISSVSRFRYENIKIFFDILYIAVSALLCIIFLKELKGVREGSIIAAIVIGNIIKLYNRIYDAITGKKENKQKKSDTDR